MRRFFVPPGTLAANSVSIDGALYAHIAKVLRMKTGDQLILCDGTGAEADAEITNVADDYLMATILRVKKYKQTAGTPVITIQQALPKGDKLDLIIEKATELGAVGVTPFNSSRSVPRIPPERLPKKLDRWQKIAAEAARQSQRADIPQISFAEGLAEVLQLADPTALKLMLWEDERTLHLKDILEQTPRPTIIDVLIGPEGGFSHEEAETAKAAGYIPVSLGQRILRTETASLAVLAILQFHWGDVG